MIQLGMNYTQIVEKLGLPEGDMSDEATRILLYGSPSLTLADTYRLQDDKLVVKSVSFYEQPKVIELYIADLGKPQISLDKYGSGDSLNTVVHIWPEAGRAITTTGTDQTSVIREDHFVPTTLENYLATWGKNLVGHQEVALDSSISV